MNPPFLLPTPQREPQHFPEGAGDALGISDTHAERGIMERVAQTLKNIKWATEWGMKQGACALVGRGILETSTKDRNTIELE